MNAVYGHAPKPPRTVRRHPTLTRKYSAIASKPAASRAGHLIDIERRGLRCHPDNHQFSFRVDANELPVDAERDQHAVIAVDAPIVSFCPANVCGKPITFQRGLNLK